MAFLLASMAVSNVQEEFSALDILLYEGETHLQNLLEVKRDQKKSVRAVLVASRLVKELRKSEQVDFRNALGFKPSSEQTHPAEYFYVRAKEINSELLNDPNVVQKFREVLHKETGFVHHVRQWVDLRSLIDYGKRGRKILKGGPTEFIEERFGHEVTNDNIIQNAILPLWGKRAHQENRNLSVMSTQDNVENSIFWSHPEVFTELLATWVITIVNAPTRMGLSFLPDKMIHQYKDQHLKTVQRPQILNEEKIAERKGTASSMLYDSSIELLFGGGHKDPTGAPDDVGTKAADTYLATLKILQWFIFYNVLLRTGIIPLGADMPFWDAVQSSLWMHLVQLPFYAWPLVPLSVGMKQHADKLKANKKRMEHVITLMDQVANSRAETREDLQKMYREALTEVVRMGLNDEKADYFSKNQRQDRFFDHIKESVKDVNPHFYQTANSLNGPKDSSQFQNFYTFPETLLSMQETALKVIDSIRAKPPLAHVKNETADLVIMTTLFMGIGTNILYYNFFSEQSFNPSWYNWWTLGETALYVYSGLLALKFFFSKPLYGKDSHIDSIIKKGPGSKNNGSLSRMLFRGNQNNGGKKADQGEMKAASIEGSSQSLSSRIKDRVIQSTPVIRDTIRRGAIFGSEMCSRIFGI